MGRTNVGARAETELLSFRNLLHVCIVHLCPASKRLDQRQRSEREMQPVVLGKN